MDCAENEDKTKLEKSAEETKIEENGDVPNPSNPNMIQFWSSIQGHIQDLVKSAIVNAKEEETHVVENKEGEPNILFTHRNSITCLDFNYSFYLHACQLCVS